MTLDPSIFVAKFVEEARDRAKMLGAALLRLERAPGAVDAIGEALREAHSIKGSALMLGFTDISQIAHQLEDLFVAARQRPSLLDGDAFDALFAAVDQMSARVDQLARGQMDAVEVGGICARLAAVLDARSRAASAGAPADRTVMPPPLPATDPAEGAELRPSLRVPIEKLDRLAHLAPEMVVQSLNAFERHTELRRVERILGRLRDRVREARIAPMEQAADPGQQLAEYTDALDAVTRRMREFLVAFSDDRVRLNLITEELRQSVIELTMLPVASVFDAFPRAVRDLARAFDKEIDLTIRGRETELDKKIVEQIAEPLTHLIRNAVDHGIETPAARERAGKPPAGRLVLSAEQQGNRILVSLKDDGGGIDPGALRAAAVRQGVASDAEIARWPDEQVFDLIFQPGFSTRASATDVSGRGVGMDVVKTVVERLGGAVRVQSEPGGGTAVTLNLPLSLALLRVVLLEAGDEVYALPTTAVRRILQVGAAEIDRLQQGPMAEVDGEHIPLTSLSALLQVPAAPAAARQTVLVAESGDGRFGVAVDAVHEEQELVFKELRGPLCHQKTFIGAALLGTGDIVPILDVNALFALASRAPAADALPPPPRRAPVRAGRVLVADDSLVAGELQKNILIAAGYESEVAGDGVEALETLRQKPWDLVIADVDMPRMTGFELTERMRADAHLREIPVIIVTSREGTDDRRRGFEAGADAYVLKRDFDQSRLLDTVRRLIGRPAGEGVHVHLPAPLRPPEIRVLIVDDSAVTREVLTSLLNSDPGIRVVGQAANGAEAVEMTATLRPDLVTMDLMMPGMDGMEATRRIMARHPTPVLFLSSFFDKDGSYSRADAIAAGALDVVEKPALMPDWRWQNSAGKLVQKVKSLAKVPVIAHIHGARKLLAQEASQSGSFVGPAADVVAIGASSGGPRVIEALLSSLPSTYALGILVVQHMTDGFTAGMLRWLQERCPLQIKVAEDGDAIVPRRVLFTPETLHLVATMGGRVRLSQAAPANGHRPSIDVTFQSVARVYGARSAGVLLTGMGSDGARGLLAIRESGGVTLVQDEDSSPIFGMPRAAIELGAAQQVLPPAGLIRSLNALHVERVRSLI